MPDTATDIGDLCARFELWRNTLERGQPCLHDAVDIAGPEERPDSAEQATAGFAPANPAASAECLFDLGLDLDHRSGQIKRACQINRAVLDREDHRLFGG